MVTIGIDQQLINSAMYEHIFLENINKLYRYAGECDNQNQYKAILEAAMVSTTERFTENSPMSPGPSVNVKNPSARKSPRKFTEILDVKKKASVQRLCADKSKYKAIRSGIMLWSSIPKKRVHTKINERVKKSFYNWILQHPQAVQYPVTNYCLKLSIDGHSEPQVAQKLLLKVSVKELHNSMASPP